MQLKTYCARTVQDAISRIKSELGAEAVIFASRSVDPPSSARGTGSWVEVTAAIERDAPSARESADSAQPPPAAFPQQSAAASFGLPAETDPVLQSLLSAGFSLESAWCLYGAARSVHAPGDARQLQRRVESLLSASVPSGGDGPAARFANRLVALMGPSGVGKTATVAKLAAQHRGSVAIITIDSYRVGAVQQMEIYGKLLRVPVALADSPAALQRRIGQFARADLILIDTPGCNFQRRECASVFARWFGGYDDLLRCLVLPAATDGDVAAHTLHGARAAGVAEVVLSKIDEVRRLGHLYQPLAQCKLPVRYCTCGPTVPNDIVAVDAAGMAHLFLYGRPSPQARSAASACA